MNEYIFYTDEGYTRAPNETKEIDNCQLLGRAIGNNQENALKKLLLENSWIKDTGFDLSRITAKQLLTNAQRRDIIEVIGYLETNEHYLNDKNLSDILKRLKTI